ncbi:MAG: SDR family NAD(P)-dependent oxidoreductase [Sphingobium sp.]
MSLLEKYGPWALIAGASEGTGAAFAHRLAAEGLKLILVARREEPLTQLAEDLRAAHGAECVTASIDLAAPDAIDRIAAITEGREVGLYISNAGGDPNGTLFFKTDIGAWNNLVARNVTAVMQVSHLLGGKMKERQRGGIILVGSGACYGGASGLGVYSGSKAFDLCLGEGMWAELRPYGVDVLNLILGRTDTPELRRFLAARGAPVPGGLATAEDVARVGLERLPFGPVHNWGLEDDEQGRMPQSAANRRARILAMEAAMQDLKAPK